MSDSTNVSAEELPLRVMRPVKRRLRPSDLWSSRHVAWMLGIRDIKVKYKQAALGPLWLVLAPLGMLAAITVAFSGVTDVDTGDVPYVLFALVGLVVWTYLQLSLLLGAQAIVSNGPLVRRSATPRLAFVTGSLLGNLPPMLVMLTATLLLSVILGTLPIQAILLPVAIAWLLLFVGSVTLLMAAIAVRFRDVVAVVPLAVQAGLFLTPVGYPIEGAPANIKLLLSLNPVTGLIEAWRWTLVGTIREVWIIGIGVAWTVVLAVAGWRIFSRLEVEFADVV